MKTNRRVLTAAAGRYRASVTISSVDGHDFIDGGARRR